MHMYIRTHLHTDKRSYTCAWAQTHTHTHTHKHKQSKICLTESMWEMSMRTVMMTETRALASGTLGIVIHSWPLPKHRLLGLLESQNLQNRSTFSCGKMAVNLHFTYKYVLQQLACVTSNGKTDWNSNRTMSRASHRRRGDQNAHVHTGSTCVNSSVCCTSPTSSACDARPANLTAWRMRRYSKHTYIRTHTHTHTYTHEHIHACTCGRATRCRA